MTTFLSPTTKSLRLTRSTSSPTITLPSGVGAVPPSVIATEAGDLLVTETAASITTETA
jgi:hypothetical protein